MSDQEITAFLSKTFLYVARARLLLVFYHFYMAYVHVFILEVLLVFSFL